MHNIIISPTNNILDSAYISAIAAIGIIFDLYLNLGIGPINTILTYLSIFIGTVTWVIRRTSLLRSIIHLIVFLKYFFFSSVSLMKPQIYFHNRLLR